MPNAIQIFLNGQAMSCPPNYSLFQLLQQLNKEKEGGLALALNQEVIPKALWANTFLNNQDQVLLITATQGG